MVHKLLTRDIYDEGVIENRGNLLDYDYYQIHRHERVNKSFDKRKNQAMFRIAKRVIESEITDRQREIYLLKLKGMKQKKHCVTFKYKSVNRNKAHSSCSIEVGQRLKILHGYERPVL
jgi:hypothetical protein